MTGILKRKFEALEDDFTYSSSSSSPSSAATSSGGESDDEYNSPRPLVSDFTPISILKTAKRAKKNQVHFDRVIVFYFQRCQGFISVPSRGGCSLGMRQKHCYSRQFTLEEFSREQLTRRREKLMEYLKEEKLLALKNMFTKNGTIESEKANNLSIDDICDEDIDMNNAEIQDGFNPLVYTAKKRRALLKRKGVKKIDKSEKHELNKIRKSRQRCGCECQDFCDPETCSCILAGIKCQRDHSNFPCGCSKDGCGNQNGRVEFNSSRVQTHFLHTVMKLELEEKSQSDDDGNDQSELSSDESSNHIECSSMESSEDDERTAPTTTSATSSTAPYHFKTDLEPAGDNSCSSDTTDSSSSSGQSESSESPFGLSSSDKSEPDFEEDYLARILHFNDSEFEDNSSDCQDNLSFFHTTDFFCDKVYESLYSSEKSDGGLFNNSLSNISKCVDENANQGVDCFTDNEISMAISTDSTVAQGEPLLKNYMDISLSSEAFDISDDNEYNFGPLYNSLNEYENLCSQQCLVTLLPGLTPATDTTACFLESLISSSESCNDNQYLEDALKSPPCPFDSLIA